MLSNVTNAGGVAQLYVNRRFYDFDVNIVNDSLRIKNINFSNWTTSNISFNGHRIDGEILTEVVPLYEPFIGIVANSSGMSSNAMSALFNYSSYNYDSPLELGIVRCSVWNYTGRSCSGSWSVLDSSRDIDLRTITGNSSGFSAYFLAENKCGNGA